VNAIEWTFQLRFAVALALGFLVGLERESTKEAQKLVFGGVRTHPIISLLGFSCAWLHQLGSSFMLPAGLLALAGLTIVAYIAKIRGEHFGTTTEISALLTFVTGAMALLADVWVAMALGVVNAMLLSEKSRLESLVERLSRAEFLATLKFLLVTVIILPILPDEPFTPFRINPATVWKMVIIVSTIGFAGYLLMRRLGTRVGLVWSGVLGGIVSSTAVTVAMGRMAQKDEARSLGTLQASILAGSIMYLRILVLLALVAPAFVWLLWWKLALLALIGSGFALSLKPHPEPGEGREIPGLENPFEITPSLLFAGMFVALTVVTSLARKAAGEMGILTLSALVGVVDIDPFILSVVSGGSVSASLTVTAVLMAMMSNTLAKAVYFTALAPSVRRQTLWRYGLWALAHVPLMFLF
jgi:uncharacterized membrane protein (DUF4010 family)